MVPNALYYYVQRGSSIMNGSKTLRHFDAAEAAQRYWDCLVENEVNDALANAARFTMGSVSRVYRQLPPALRKAPRSREMLRMQFDVVDRTRRYCTVRVGFGCKAGCCGTSRRHTVGCGNSRAEEKEKKRMRTRYTLINMLVNIGGQFLTMLLSFISRMVFIRCLSAAYLGVNGLFTDVLSILNFAELGIGTAMVFSMYEPAARDDTQKLSRLMNLYKWMYRAVAASVLLFGLVLLPFLPHLIKGGEGIEHITLIYMMYVLGSASSYLLNYKSSIYQAYQKGYIRAGWNMVCECIKTVLQIAVLLLTGNFILYLAVQQVVQFLPNIMVSRRVDKEFPYLKECRELPEKEERNGILKNIGAMSMHKLATVIVRNTDSLLMSSFIGLATVGLYSNYRLVLNALNNLLNKFATAFSGSVGNFAALENSDRLYRVYKEMDFLFFCAVRLPDRRADDAVQPAYRPAVWRGILFSDDHRGDYCDRVLYLADAADEPAVPGGHGAVLERPL